LAQIGKGRRGAAWARAGARAVTALVALVAGCERAPEVPARSAPEHARAVAAFRGGLAAFDVGDDVYADTRFAELTRLAPGEPAGWANWAALALRQRDFEAAAERLEKARALAPKDARVFHLLGLLESQRGRSAQAVEHLRKAMELDPGNLRVAYALAQEVERQADANSEAEVQKLIAQIAAMQPDNLAAQLELARIAARRGDRATLQGALRRLATHADKWPADAQDALRALAAAAEGSETRAAAARTSLLRNVLWQVPEFRRDFAAIKAPPGEDVEPFARPVRLEAPLFRTAAADTALKFEPQPVASAGTGKWQWTGAVQLGADGTPVAAFADGRKLRLENGAALDFPGGKAAVMPSREGVLQIDFNYDFKTDFVLAGAGGVRFYRQENATTFVDETAHTKLAASVLNGRYTGAWAADVEADGDLDVVLGTADSDPVVLRNNGDGTFVPIPLFAGAKGLRQFAWADLDGDGVPDALLLDAAGHVHLFRNARQGVFREATLPSLAPVKAIAVADLDGDGLLDVLVVMADGALVRLATARGKADWQKTEVAHVSPAQLDRLSGEVRMHVADLDNNGALDVIVAPVDNERGTAVWLGNESGALVPVENMAPALRVFDVADLEGKGRLDLLGLTSGGKVVRAVNQGSRNYHWQVVRPRAAQAFGDQRINPFGVGGEVEVRTGALLQKQLITGPQVHFGLGEYTAADIVRVVWPNGAVRAEFEVKADQAVVTEQRLKGSCPFLFAWDGTRMRFVKDAVPWGSAIGLRINTLGSAQIAATEEWYRIGRDQLVARDGYYDLRFTAELWEVYYYDQLALTTVDHSEGTEIFVDERFVIPPAKLAITAVATPQPVARALDDTGADVTELVRKVDGKAVASFGRGQYQGVTRDHFIEIDLGDAVQTGGPLYLIGHGSIYPTDSSINVAMTQGQRWRAQSLRLEVPDGRGGWRVANANLGFPAGRKKTVLIDLTGLFAAGMPHRVRLRTNLEIYWDAFEWAAGKPDTRLRTQRLAPAFADLHYRGYSVIERADAGSPEVPDYQRIAGTKQRWRDLTGYYTRFGDVRELLQDVDDRYVIMNSGDEMSLRFAAPPAPAAGWVRDFVIMGDGWIKDGDYNSTFSQTVEPLPYHDERDYSKRPARLEDEVAYQRHPEDWQRWHTRYVSPDVFENALRGGGR
jgi:Tfp pilus assembly protein PilF